MAGSDRRRGSDQPRAVAQRRSVHHIEDPAPLQVSVLSGLDRLTVDDLATSVLLRRERLVLVHADLSTVARGFVRVHVHSGAGSGASYDYPILNNCVNCTMCAALVGQLSALARERNFAAALVQLHPGLEPDGLLRGLQRGLPATVRLDTHVAVLTADWLEILAGGTVLADHDATLGAGDDRYAAALVCAAVETASTIVVAARPARSAEQLDEERAVLDLLAPAAVRLRQRHVLDVPVEDILFTGRFDPAQLDPLSPYGIRDGERQLTGISSLTLVRWSAKRPLHPIRLHAALDQLADGVIRSSGRLDVADQPDVVVGWDSAGDYLQFGPIARWPGEAGVRRSSLTLLGDGLDEAHIHAVLDGCLLDDAELAILTSTWNELGDICPTFSGPAPSGCSDELIDTDNPSSPASQWRLRGDDAA